MGRKRVRNKQWEHLLLCHICVDVQHWKLGEVEQG